MVTRPVPPEATAMGIPARFVTKGYADPEFEVEKRRRDMQEKAGFDLYALGEDVPTPWFDLFTRSLINCTVLTKRCIQ